MEEDTIVGLVQDGTASVELNTALLESAVDLTLISVENTADPISDDFRFGFDIAESSDFLFSDDNGFTPLEGEIELTGTITFSHPVGDITIGDFDIGFDSSRRTENISGLFLENNVDGLFPEGTILLDISNLESIEINEGTLNIGSADLLLAPEFATLLVETEFLIFDLTGFDIGDAALNAISDCDLL